MLLDIKKLIHSNTPAQSGSFAAQFAPQDLPVGFLMPVPAQVSYEAHHEGDGAALSMDILCDAVIRCDRCLTEVPRTYRFRAEHLVRESDWTSDEPELPLSSQGVLDLEKLCYDELMLNLPSSLLCKPDCQGLCPVCGKPRELGCGCRQNVGDDRLSILQQLLS